MMATFFRRATCSLALLAARAYGNLCGLGESVRAFRGSLKPKASTKDTPLLCEPSLPECWSEGVVADGPGRGDAFLTIVWNDWDHSHRRVHASLAIHTATGSPCALPFSMQVGISECMDDNCIRYSDTCSDYFGEFIHFDDKTLGTCRDVVARGMCEMLLGDGITLARDRCRQSCGSCRAHRRCIALTHTLPKLQQFATWAWYSQWYQDSVLHHLLVHPDGLFVPPQDQFYVEFGFRPQAGRLGPDSNSEYLRRIGWRGIVFDETHHDPDRGLFAELITPDNAVSIFRKHDVPKDLGMVSIDIDSCDVWVFLGLTKVFRPRVVLIEYNRFHKFDANLTLDCRKPSRPEGLAESNLFGSSIHAIATAAKLRGYSVAWVVRCFDVVLVRSDLVCPGTKLANLESFAAFTITDGGCADPWGAFSDVAISPESQREWLLDVGVHGFGEDV